ncbi:MAG TPA: hypothetical protein VIL65_07390 [Beijerinckiaceae bacterium]|jgi:hypothetical protein
MTGSTRSWPRKAVVVGLVGVVAGLSVPGGGHAEDDAGVRAFFVSQQPAARPAAAPMQSVTLPRFVPLPLPAAVAIARPSGAKAHARRAPDRAPKLEYASLPKEPAVEKPAVVSGPRLPPLQAILRDDTLRPGDIVMFPDGPRVFNGQTSEKHKAASFEPVAKSRLVTASARKALAALPVASTNTGAVPSALAARSPLRAAPKLAGNGSTLRQTALNEVAGQAAASTIRVVYPRLGGPVTVER